MPGIVLVETVRSMKRKRRRYGLNPESRLNLSQAFPVMCVHLMGKALNRGILEWAFKFTTTHHTRCLVLYSVNGADCPCTTIIKGLRQLYPRLSLFIVYTFVGSNRHV